MSLDPTSWGWPFPATWAAFFVIVMLRANATYWAGRLVRRGVAAGAGASRLGRPAYRRAAGWVDRWGAPVVTVSFLTVGVQTMVNLAAGASRMSQWRYLPAVVLGGVLWATIYASLGFVGLAALANLWRASPVGAVAVVVVLLGLLAAFLLWQRRWPARRDPDGEPVVEQPARPGRPEGSAQPGDQ